MKKDFRKIAAAVAGSLFFAYYIALKIADPGTFVSFSLVWPFAGLALWTPVFLGGRIAAFLRKGVFRRKPVKIIAGMAIAAFLAVCGVFLIVISTPLRDISAKESEYLLVLGGGIRTDGEPSESLRTRLDAAAEYRRRHPGVTVIVSGGKGKNEPWSEAETMARYLETAAGTGGPSILKEDRSRDTIQNFRYSLALIREREKLLHGDRNLETDPPAVRVMTNDFHLKRAVFLARRTGYQAVSGEPVPSPLVCVPNNYLREVGAWWKLGIRMLAGGFPDESPR